MKKLLKSAAAGAVTCVLMTGAASAQINNTGPGSNNQINNNTNSNFVCVNNNNANVNSSNQQQSNTGSANNSGNTNSGGASSGNASNSNRTNTNVSANNGCPAGTRSVPAGSAEAKAARGGVAPAGQPAAAGAKVDAQGRVLPATGVDEGAEVAAIGLAGTAAAAIAVAAGTSYYRRRALN